MCNSINSIAFCMVSSHNSEMTFNSISQRHLSDLHQKIQYEFKQGRLISELEDIDFQIKVFIKKEKESVKNFKQVLRMLVQLNKDGVIIWRVPRSDEYKCYMDIIEDEEIFTGYIVRIHDYEKLCSVFHQAGIMDEDVDDGRLLIFQNGEFYIGKNRTPLSLASKSRTKYYKVLKAIFELSKSKPNGMTEKQIIKQIYGIKKNTLTKPKIINAINDSIKPILGERYDFFDWQNNGKLFFNNPLLKDFERPKNGK